MSQLVAAASSDAPSASSSRSAASPACDVYLAVNESDPASEIESLFLSLSLQLSGLRIQSHSNSQQRIRECIHRCSHKAITQLASHSASSKSVSPSPSSISSSSVADARHVLFLLSSRSFLDLNSQQIKDLQTAVQAQIPITIILTESSAWIDANNIEHSSPPLDTIPAAFSSVFTPAHTIHLMQTYWSAGIGRLIHRIQTATQHSSQSGHRRNDTDLSTIVPNPCLPFALAKVLVDAKFGEQVLALTATDDKSVEAQQDELLTSLLESSPSLSGNEMSQAFFPVQGGMLAVATDESLPPKETEPAKGNTVRLVAHDAHTTDFAAQLRQLLSSASYTVHENESHEAVDFLVCIYHHTWKHDSQATKVVETALTKSIPVFLVIDDGSAKHFSNLSTSDAVLHSVLAKLSRRDILRFAKQYQKEFQANLLDMLPAPVNVDAEDGGRRMATAIDLQRVGELHRWVIEHAEHGAFTPYYPQFFSRVLAEDEAIPPSEKPHITAKDVSEFFAELSNNTFLGSLSGVSRLLFALADYPAPALTEDETTEPPDRIRVIRKRQGEAYYVNRRATRLVLQYLRRLWFSAVPKDHHPISPAASTDASLFSSFNLPSLALIHGTDYSAHLRFPQHPCHYFRRLFQSAIFSKDKLMDSLVLLLDYSGARWLLPQFSPDSSANERAQWNLTLEAEVMSFARELILLSTCTAAPPAENAAPETPEEAPVIDFAQAAASFGLVAVVTSLVQARYSYTYDDTCLRSQFGNELERSLSEDLSPNTPARLNLDLNPLTNLHRIQNQDWLSLFAVCVQSGCAELINQILDCELLLLLPYLANAVTIYDSTSQYPSLKDKEPVVDDACIATWELLGEISRVSADEPPTVYLLPKACASLLATAARIRAVPPPENERVRERNGWKQLARLQTLIAAVIPALESDQSLPVEGEDHSGSDATPPEFPWKTQGVLQFAPFPSGRRASGQLAQQLKQEVKHFILDATIVDATGKVEATVLPILSGGEYSVTISAVEAQAAANGAAPARMHLSFRIHLRSNISPENEKVFKFSGGVVWDTVNASSVARVLENPIVDVDSDQLAGEPWGTFSLTLVKPVREFDWSENPEAPPAAEEAAAEAEAEAPPVEVEQAIPAEAAPEASIVPESVESEKPAPEEAVAPVEPEAAVVASVAEIVAEPAHDAPQDEQKVEPVVAVAEPVAEVAAEPASVSEESKPEESNEEAKAEEEQPQPVEESEAKPEATPEPEVEASAPVETAQSVEPEQPVVEVSAVATEAVSQAAEAKEAAPVVEPKKDKTSPSKSEASGKLKSKTAAKSKEATKPKEPAAKSKTGASSKKTSSVSPAKEAAAASKDVPPQPQETAVVSEVAAVSEPVAVIEAAPVKEEVVAKETPSKGAKDAKTSSKKDAPSKSSKDAKGAKKGAKVGGTGAGVRPLPPTSNPYPVAKSPPPQPEPAAVEPPAEAKAVDAPSAEEVKAEPESTPEVAAEPEPIVEPFPEPPPQKEPTPEPVVEPTSEPEQEPEPEVEPEPEPVPVPEPKQPEPQPEPAPAQSFLTGVDAEEEEEEQKEAAPVLVAVSSPPPKTPQQSALESESEEEEEEEQNGPRIVTLVDSTKKNPVVNSGVHYTLDAILGTVLYELDAGSLKPATREFRPWNERFVDEDRLAKQRARKRYDRLTRLLKLEATPGKSHEKVLEVKQLKEEVEREGVRDTDSGQVVEEQINADLDELTKARHLQQEAKALRRLKKQRALEKRDRDRSRLESLLESMERDNPAARMAADLEAMKERNARVAEEKQRKKIEEAELDKQRQAAAAEQVAARMTATGGIPLFQRMETTFQAKQNSQLEMMRKLEQERKKAKREHEAAYGARSPKNSRKKKIQNVERQEANDDDFAIAEPVPVQHVQEEAKQPEPAVVEAVVEPERARTPVARKQPQVQPQSQSRKAITSPKPNVSLPAIQSPPKGVAKPAQAKGPISPPPPSAAVAAAMAALSPPVAASTPPITASKPQSAASTPVQPLTPATSSTAAVLQAARAVAPVQAAATPSKSITSPQKKPMGKSASAAGLLQPIKKP